MADVNNIPKTQHLAPFLQTLVNQKANKVISNADSAIETFKTSGIIEGIDSSFSDVQKTETFFSQLFNKGAGPIV